MFSPSAEREMPVPRGRIELGSPPEIDITNDRLGTLLMERRRAMGLKIEEIAEDIKVKSEYLRFIEREDFDRLPTPQYARLFVKAYAERIGFNISEIYALLDVNQPSLSGTPKAKVGSPSARDLHVAGTQATEAGASKTVPKSAAFWWGSGAAVVVLLLAAWIILNWGARTEDISSVATKDQPSARAVMSLSPDEPKSPVDAPEPAPEPGPMRLVVRFDRETWAALMADGNIVARRNFGAGEQLEANAADNFRLSLGHTEGVAAWIDGRALRPFRGWAERLEGHLITRDTVQMWLDTLETAGTAPATAKFPSVHGDTAGIR